VHSESIDSKDSYIGSADSSEEADDCQDTIPNEWAPLPASPPIFLETEKHISEGLSQLQPTFRLSSPFNFARVGVPETTVASDGSNAASIVDTNVFSNVLQLLQLQQQQERNRSAGHRSRRMSLIR
jgi:hypothetical protein